MAFDETRYAAVKSRLYLCASVSLLSVKSKKLCPCNAADIHVFTWTEGLHGAW